MESSTYSLNNLIDVEANQVSAQTIDCDSIGVNSLTALDIETKNLTINQTTSTHSLTTTNLTATDTSTHTLSADTATTTTLAATDTEISNKLKTKLLEVTDISTIKEEKCETLTTTTSTSLTNVTINDKKINSIIIPDNNSSTFVTDNAEQTLTNKAISSGIITNFPLELLDTSLVNKILTFLSPIQAFYDINRDTAFKLLKPFIIDNDLGVAVNMDLILAPIAISAGYFSNECGHPLYSEVGSKRIVEMKLNYDPISGDLSTSNNFKGHFVDTSYSKNKLIFSNNDSKLDETSLLYDVNTSKCTMADLDCKDVTCASATATGQIKGSGLACTNFIGGHLLYSEPITQLIKELPFFYDPLAGFSSSSKLSASEIYSSLFTNPSFINGKLLKSSSNHIIESAITIDNNDLTTVGAVQASEIIATNSIINSSYQGLRMLISSADKRIIEITIPNFNLPTTPIPLDPVLIALPIPTDYLNWWTYQWWLSMPKGLTGERGEKGEKGDSGESGNNIITMLASATAGVLGGMLGALAAFDPLGLLPRPPNPPAISADSSGNLAASGGMSAAGDITKLGEDGSEVFKVNGNGLITSSAGLTTAGAVSANTIASTSMTATTIASTSLSAATATIASLQIANELTVATTPSTTTITQSTANATDINDHTTAKNLMIKSADKANGQAAHLMLEAGNSSSGSNGNIIMQSDVQSTCRNYFQSIQRNTIELTESTNLQNSLYSVIIAKCQKNSDEKKQDEDITITLPVLTSINNGMLLHIVKSSNLNATGKVIIVVSNILSEQIDYLLTQITLDCDNDRIDLIADSNLKQWFSQ